MTILKRCASALSALVMMISSAGAYNCSAEGTTVKDSKTNNTREFFRVENLEVEDWTKE